MEKSAPGVNVMKIGVFLENQCYDKLLLLKSSILSQN
jgi:hypothetical protein